MSNKSQISNISLVGDLNLSKNKLEVIPFGESGYLKNDGVIYGNTLSPIYKQKMNVDAEYYTKDGKKVNVTNHSVVVENSAKLTFSTNKLVEEKLSVSDLLSYDSGAYTKVDDTTFYLKQHNQDEEHDFSLSTNHIASVLTARSIYNVGALVLYIDTSNNYKISFWDATGELVSEQLSWTEVNTPLITWYKKADNLYFLSVFSDSGADFQGSVLSYALDVSSTPVFYPITFESNTSQTETVTTTTTYEYKDFLSTRYYEPIFSQSKGGYTNQSVNLTMQQPFSMSLPTDINWSNPCGIKIYLYWTSALEVSSTVGGVTKYVGASYSDILAKDISNLTDVTPEYDFTNITDPNLVAVLPLVYAGQHGNFTVMVGDTWLDRAMDKITMNVNVNGTIQQAFVSTLEHRWKDGAIPELFFMDGNNTDKKACGFLWAKVQYTSAGVQHEERFKVIPQCDFKDSDAWRSGWDYVALFDATDSDPVDTVTRTGIQSQTSATVSSTSLVPLNAFLDGGRLICTDIPANDTNDDTHFAKGLFGFTGAIASAALESGVYKVKYNGDGANTFFLALAQDPNHAYPYSFISRTISLDKNYFRYVLHTKGFGDIEYDENGNVLSEPKETVIMYDSGFNKVIINPGYYTGNGSLSNGSVYQKGNWRILYNNNLVSNISYGTTDKIGTLLCDWNIIDEVLCIDEDFIVIRDTFGNIIKYSTATIANDEIAPYKVINNRFIVVGTTSYYNCYDLKTNQKLHYASDYNNRFLMGIECDNFLKNTTDNDKMFDENTLIDTAIEGSAQNANYEISNNPISSYKLEPEVITKVWMRTNPFMLKSESSMPVDIYFSMNGVTAVYFTSYKNGVFVRDTALDLAYLPTGIMYNPNIFTKIIETYLLDTFAVNSSTATAYPFNKYNGQVFLSYAMLNGLENAENMFCIQTLVYMISEDKIWEVYYDNGNLSNLQPIASIKGLKYLGCLPTAAIFWSPADRTFWSFTGDAILRKVIQANEISAIYGSWYCTSTQHLYVGTNIGLLCINDVNNFLLTDLKRVTGMWFFDDYFVAKNTSYTSGVAETKDWEISFIPEKLQIGGSMTFRVKWLGSIENFKSRIDCLYFRLAKNYSPTLSPVDPFFTIRSETMTDVGTECETKTITDFEFDELTDTAYVRFQPQYQSAVAFSFEVTTNCPIVSMAIGNTSTQEMAQISQINI